jgi:uncharacterized protein (DUF1800 family)
MNRTEFLSSFIPKDNVQTNALIPFTKQLSQEQALHLLRRTTFATNWQTIKQFTGKTATEAVNMLLDNALKVAKPTVPTWVNDTFQPWWKLPKADQQASTDAAYKKLYDENYQLKRWWIEAMAADTVSIREKMTLFWHGHFTTKFAVDQVMPAQSMYRQNDMFRRLHQGNFRDLVEGISMDGAMLVFLNGQDSTKAKPNENYSRELLELYTTGIGHYTEKDVQEGARVFTGWRTNFFTGEWNGRDYYKTFLWTSEHDYFAKNYLGETIPYPTDVSEDGVFKYEIKLLVDIILRKRAEAVSMFICEKLYRYFVYSNAAKVNQDIVRDMAQTFRDNNFEIRPVLAQLLTSTFFFDEANIGVQIKTPAELIVGITKHFDVKGDWKEWVMVTMGQELLNPPNVAGWPGYRKWADTRTFPFGVQQIGYFIWNQKDDDILAWVKQFDDYDDASKLTANMCALFLVKPPTKAQLDKHLNNVLGGSPYYEWTNMLKNAGTVGLRVKYFMSQLIKSPDFHLA